jgi:hypothetical protein
MLPTSALASRLSAAGVSSWPRCTAGSAAAAPNRANGRMPSLRALAVAYDRPARSDTRINLTGSYDNVDRDARFGGSHQVRMGPGGAEPFVVRLDHDPPASYPPVQHRVGELSVDVRGMAEPAGQLTGAQRAGHGDKIVGTKAAQAQASGPVVSSGKPAPATTLSSA